ncbi:MAG TPA: hypothetical protein VFY23_04200 [Candidatus Limnocylindrales bacterium]|nr:hypothetical protein [Candidatus Limnocylindrales bacterium]
MAATTASRGWRLELDGFEHTIEIGPTRMGRPTEVYLDNRVVGRLPRILWARARLRFRVGSHQALLEAAMRRAAFEDARRVHGLRIDGVALGPPTSIVGRPDRPAVRGAPRRHRLRAALAPVAMSAGLGIGAGLLLASGRVASSPRGVVLEYLVAIIGALAVIGTPVAVAQLAVRRRWGAMQDAFVQYAAPLALGFVAGNRLSELVPAHGVEAAGGLALLSGFVILGGILLGAGLSRLIRGRRRPRDLAVAGTSELDEQLSAWTAVGLVLFGTGLLSLAATAVAAALGIAGASWHDLGSTMTPLAVAGVALILTAVIPVGLGHRREDRPGPDMG